MCRLALINDTGIKYIEKHYGLKDLFNYLERQLGGHGNGYCLIYKDGSYKIDKGVQLTNAEVAEKILDNINDIKWVIYHTRLASIGRINNHNCHPFENKGRVLAMNGTERQYKVVDDTLTDTENILLASEHIKEDTKEYRSVFLGYENGKVFANKNFGSLKYISCKNGGKIFASNFPKEYYIDNIIYEAPQNFEEDKTIKHLYVSKSSFKNAYGYYDDYYYQGLR
jgi:predicted glutamine amidotransferase